MAIRDAGELHLMDLKKVAAYAASPEGIAAAAAAKKKKKKYTTLTTAARENREGRAVDVKNYLGAGPGKSKLG